MLERIVFGNTLENWGISILIILGTILIAKLIVFFNKKIILPFVKKTSNELDDFIYNSVESPIIFGLLLIGMWVAIHRLNYPDHLLTTIDDTYKILIILNFTWLIARLSDNLLNFSVTKASDNTKTGRVHRKKMMPIIKRTILVIVWAIGIVTALANVGVNITAIIGTLGIGGIAFALAAQDTIKNIFGAFTILTDRPFSIGDTVRIDSFEGTIIDIGIRSTKMRNSDKRKITFPNYKIADASVINISTEPMRRVTVKIGLTYNTTPEKMTEAIAILKNIPSKIHFVSQKELTANFTDFADSALVITFVYFIEKKGDVGATTSNVNMEILTSFNQAGLNFAFPSQTLYIDKKSEI